MQKKYIIPATTELIFQSQAILLDVSNGGELGGIGEPGDGGAGGAMTPARLVNP